MKYLEYLKINESLQDGIKPEDLYVLCINGVPQSNIFIHHREASYKQDELNEITPGRPYECKTLSEVFELVTTINKYNL